MRSAPASGPAKIRSNAMNRPKNTAQTPQRWNRRSALASCSGPKCLGNRRPSRSNSGRPPRRPGPKVPGNPPAEPLEQRPTTATADRITYRVADDRTGTRGDADPERRDNMLSGQQRRTDQDDLPRQRDAQAFHTDHDSDHN